MIFIQAKTRKDLNRIIRDGQGYPIKSFDVIKKVDGGYNCFETNSEYEIWKKQK